MSGQYPIYRSVSGPLDVSTCRHCATTIWRRAAETYGPKSMDAGRWVHGVPGQAESVACAGSPVAEPAE